MKRCRDDRPELWVSDNASPPPAQELDRMWSAIWKDFAIHLSNLLQEGELPPHPSRDTPCPSLSSCVTTTGFDFFHDVLLLVKKHIDIPEPYVPEDLKNIVLQLQDFLMKEHVPVEIQQLTSQVLELWCRKGLVLTRALCVKLFRYMLTTTLQKTLVTDVKNLWSFSKILVSMNCQNEAFGCHVPELLMLVGNKQFLSMKEGRCLAAVCVTLDVNLVQEFHKRVKNELLQCSKKQATAYGQIYTVAINTATPRVREVIVDVCLKDLILHVLQARRKGLYMCGLGRQVMHVLHVMHNSRRHVTMKKMLMQTYEPFIWRFITSNNNVHRSNSAEVLMDLYPMEHPHRQRMENRELLERQHNTISKLLTDSCHVVRIIATNGVCQILPDFWSAIPAHWRYQWLQALVCDLSSDGSCFEVRRNVYRHLSKLLKNEQIAHTLRELLPSLSQHIHDKNERVRKSFVELLICAKGSGLMSFYKVVPMEHIITRLQMEGRSVGEQLVKLVFSHILVPTQSANERLKRIAVLADRSVSATRNFFRYSNHVLKFPDAVELMQNILVHLQVSFCNNKENMNADGKTKRSSTENPDVIRGLLDVVSILWLLHERELERSRKLKQLYKLVRICYPLLLHFYKDSDVGVLSSLLFLGSLVPLHVIKKVCTGSSFCMSRLRKLTLDRNVKEACLMWVSPLCSWRQGAEVLALVMEWLDEAFRTENLNSSATAESLQRRRKVHFESRGSKPLLALHILEAVFLCPTNMAAMMNVKRDSVLELWQYLDRITLTIEMRMVGLLKSPLLSDEFLRLCLLRYARLTVVLGKVQGAELPDTCQHFLKLLDWSVRVLLPHVPETMPLESEVEVPLAVNMLQDLTKMADMIVAIGMANDDFISHVVKFAVVLLETGCALMFVHSVVCLSYRLVEHCRAYHGRDDKRQLFRVVIPMLVHGILVVFKKGNYRQETVLQCVENMGAVRVFLSKVLLLGVQYYGGMSKLVCGVVINCINAVVGIVMNNIDELGTLRPVKTVRDLPYLAAQVLGVFWKQDLLSVLFSCLLKKQICIQYSQDPLQLVSAIQILHATVFNRGAMPVRSLKGVALAAVLALGKQETVRQNLLSLAKEMMESVLKELGLSEEVV